MKNVYGNLYIHRNHINDLPNEFLDLVREAASLISSTIEWNLVCVRRERNVVNFLHYPSFFKDPHPALTRSTRVTIATMKVESRSISQKNPLILHRKETFLNPSDPLYSKFQSLTEQEEIHGLYQTSLLRYIGRKRFWDNLLRSKGLRIEDHSLVVVPEQRETHYILGMSNSETVVQLNLFDTPTFAPSNDNTDDPFPSADDVLKRSSITAMSRKTPSTPALISVEENLIHGPIFDWGCGRGRDIQFFREQGYEAEGWDPAHKTDTPPTSFPKGHFHWVQNAYVLNTITEQAIREDIVQQIFDFLPVGGHLYIAVRSANEIRQHAASRNWKRFQDGWLTGSGSFQKGFTPQELINLLRNCGFQAIEIVRDQPVIILATKH